MKKPYVFANWKMNLSLPQSVALARAVVNGALENGAEIVLCPSFTSLTPVMAVIKGSGIQLGGQDLSGEENGAFTGQVSAAMLKEAGCQYVIVGHSERRQNLGESDNLISRKIAMALRHDLTPVLCIGENREERESGKWREIILRQMREDLSLTAPDNSLVIIAYEPIWAIGSGQPVTARQASETADFIKQSLFDIFGPEQEKKRFVIIYGGSVDGDNVKDFVGRGLTEGVLVGTSSLSADKLLAVVNNIFTNYVF